MSQSRLHSAFESITNIVIGFSVALVSQILIFPLFDIHVGLETNLGISAWFTAISIVRSYVLRRAFNMITQRVKANEKAQ